jgi:hypothetical protein
MLNVDDIIRELNDGASIDRRLVVGLRQALHLAKEGGVLRQDAPVYAKLRSVGLQDDTSIRIPNV